MRGSATTKPDQMQEEGNSGQEEIVPSLEIPAVHIQESCLRLRVHCITYNLNSSIISPIPQDLLQIPALSKGDTGCCSPGGDIYAVATQENSSSYKWEKAWACALGNDYKKVAAVNLSSIHLVVFLRSRLESVLQAAKTAKVATGVGNVIGNKGAAAVSLCFTGRRKVLVISSHLAAHNGKVHQRNSDYHRIQHGLFNPHPTPSRSLPKRNQVADEATLSSQQKLRAAGEANGRERGTKLDATESHHVTLWMGDLNYRVDGRRKAVQHAMEAGMYEVLHANDQLSRERKRGTAFVGFNEGEIHFPPTYKFDRHTDTYDTSPKNRIPSWTDRILWKTSHNVRRGAVLLGHYSSVSSIKVSDHRPVVALFDLDLSQIPPVLKWQSEFDATRLRMAQNLKDELLLRERFLPEFYRRKAPGLHSFCKKAMDPQKWIIQAEIAGVLESPRNPLHA